MGIVQKQSFEADSIKRGVEKASENFGIESQ